jgi:hypothetical protein
MDLVDILHLEDDQDIVKLLRMNARSAHLSYASSDTLEGYGEALDKYDVKVYVIDGNFLNKPGGFVDFFAGDAIELIRAKKGRDAKIILYSYPSGDMPNEYLIEFGERMGVTYITKEQPDSFRKVIDEVRRMISG